MASIISTSTDEESSTSSPLLPRLLFGTNNETRQSGSEEEEEAETTPCGKTLESDKVKVLETNVSAQSATCITVPPTANSAPFCSTEANADVLKEACADDAQQINFMAEYLELKDTLAKANMARKEILVKMQQWCEEMELVEQQYNEQQQECQTQIAALRKINEKIEQMKLYDDVLQKDYAKLMQEISVKTEQVKTMRANVRSLEQHQLASFENVPKHEEDSKDKPDYVDRLEHDRVVKDLQRQLSQLLAQNLKMKDMDKQHNKEIKFLKIRLTSEQSLAENFAMKAKEKQYNKDMNCLKTKQTASEELIKKSRAEIELLKAKDDRHWYCGGCHKYWPSSALGSSNSSKGGELCPRCLYTVRR